MNDLPLAGIRVLELGWYVAAPSCGRVLADMGAEVIKLETSKRPDMVRLGPFIKGQPTAAAYPDYGAGKRSITIDLRTEAGRAVTYELMRSCDVFTENFSREAIRRFGMDAEHLHAANPALIILRMPAFGTSGPYTDYASYGVNAQALAGINYMTGHADSPPTGPSLALPDYLTGVYGATVVAMALEYRRRRGVGLEIELSQFEAAVSIMGAEIVQAQLGNSPPQRAGNRDPGMVPHGLFPCAGTDRWSAIVATSDEEWQRLVALLGAPAWAAGLESLAARRQAEEQIHARLAEWTASQDAWVVFTRLQECGIPAGVVQNIRDLMERDEHLQARGYWIDHRDPRWGELRYHPVPVRFVGERPPAARFQPAAALGEANGYVFGALLGLSEERRAELADAGVIR